MTQEARVYPPEFTLSTLPSNPRDYKGQLVTLIANGTRTLYYSDGTAFTAVGGGSGSSSSTASGAVTSRNVIIETDWWTDVDDAVALREAIELERLGVWNILAISINTTLAAGAKAVDVLALFDGRPNMPIFIPKTSHVPSSTPSYQTNMTGTTLPSGSATTITTTMAVPDAVAGITRILTDVAGKVEIISIGYLNNLQELHQAQPALVAAKISKLWVMGGDWPNGSENNFTRDAQSRASAAYVCANWPTPITFSGFGIGNLIITGASLAPLATTDPVGKAIADFVAAQGGNAIFGRNSWDPMNVLLAASGSVKKGGYTSITGTASVDATTGNNTFTAGAGSHEYVLRDPAVADNYYVQTINDLILPNAARKTFKYADGTTYLAPPLPRSDTGTYVKTIPVKNADVDVANLLQYWNAQDNSDQADAALIGTVFNRLRGPLASGSLQMTAAGSLRPAMATKGGLRCWQFSGAQVLTAPNVVMPDILTVYAKVWLDVTPTSNQTFVASSNATTTYTLRNFHLKTVAAAAAQAASFFNNATVTSDSASAAAISTGAWHVVAMRRSATLVQALIDGASASGGTAKANSSDPASCSLNIGGVLATGGTEPLVGFIREVRIYGSTHTDAQVAAITAEMV